MLELETKFEYFGDDVDTLPRICFIAAPVVGGATTINIETVLH